MTRTLYFLAVLPLIFVPACGVSPNRDAGPSSDEPSDSGSMPTDSGSTAAHDAGPDAGHQTTEDAGHVPDAGIPDAGHQMSVDAGSAADAGQMTQPDAGTVTPDAGSGNGHSIQTVFIILMENENWSSVNTAPYISSLLALGAHAEKYLNVPGIHPSEPNYLWLEAGTNFGILADGVPSSDHQATTAHLVTQLDNAGISWKAYAEGITAGQCPLTALGSSTCGYAPKHCPMVYFNDITNDNDPTAPVCIAHVVPYTNLATDLQNGTVGRYNFITPNLDDDMHSSCPPTNNEVTQGNNWLSANVPTILNSQVFKDGGALFITWDESEGSNAATAPIGMIVLSPFAKTNYSNTIAYNHSSTLRTMQEIFGVSPFLGGAANATDLSDMFTHFP